MRNHPATGPVLAIFGAVAFFVVSLFTWYTIDLAPAGGLLGIGIVGTLLVMFHILGGPQPSEIVTVQPISWLGALATIASTTVAVVAPEPMHMTFLPL